MWNYEIKENIIGEVCSQQAYNPIQLSKVHKRKFHNLTVTTNRFITDQQ